MPFEQYAEYYDALYDDKDYQAEAGYVQRLIEAHRPGAKTLLDLGCGTGGHARALTSAGYRVTGVDLSAQQIQLARDKHDARRQPGGGIEFLQGDIRTLRLKKTFDVVTSLFHVISYQVRNADLMAAFRTARTHVTDDGLFIFDAWYGPAVLNTRPERRIKRVETPSTHILRIAEPQMFPNENCVNVHYELLIEEKEDRRLGRIREDHRMRYLFLPEIDDLLSRAGFRRCAAQGWMDEADLGEQTWSACIVARPVAMEEVKVRPPIQAAGQLPGRRRILMVHPEGNVNNNPNLTGIIQMLCQRGCEIDYVALKKDYSQTAPCHGVRMGLYPPNGRNELDGFVMLEEAVLRSGQAIKEHVQQRLPAYDLVIGVDRGIIEANLIAGVQQAPCGLISYEILFGKEAGAGLKEVEIASCRQLVFAVCQDRVRSGLLIEENRLAPQIVIDIPMGGRGAHAPEKSDYLRRTLGIASQMKIALVIGSLARWTMTDYLIYCLKDWPEDWALVIHNRYGMDNDVRHYLARHGHMQNLFFNTHSEQTHATMKRVIQSADIGLALYRPLPNNVFVGDNIRHIGLASGKIATYLQYGLPVVVNEIGEMSDHVRQFELGAVIDTDTKFVPRFSSDQLASMSDNCHRFYARYLDLNHTVAPLLPIVDALGAGEGMRAGTASAANAPVPN